MRMSVLLAATAFRPFLLSAAPSRNPAVVPAASQMAIARSSIFLLVKNLVIRAFMAHNSSARQEPEPMSPILQELSSFDNTIKDRKRRSVGNEPLNRAADILAGGKQGGPKQGGECQLARAIAQTSAESRRSAAATRAQCR